MVAIAQSVVQTLLVKEQLLV